MKQDLFQDLLHAAHHVYSSTDALQQFAPWPSDLLYADRPVRPVPAIRQIKKWSDMHQLHIATQQGADFGDWKQTYTEDEVGFGFLQDYGYLELYGPNGHFQTDQGRAYIGYWEGAYIIHGTGIKQKKYMLFSVVQAISKAEAQNPPY